MGPLEPHFNEMFIKTQQFSFHKMRLKMSIEFRPFYLGRNELNTHVT